MIALDKGWVKAGCIHYVKILEMDEGFKRVSRG